MSNNNGSVGCGTLVFVFIVVALLLGSCGSDDRDREYGNTLRSGYEKYITGQEMSREEYNAVKSYNKWLDKQDNSKTYSEWD